MRLGPLPLFVSLWLSVCSSAFQLHLGGSGNGRSRLTRHSFQHYRFRVVKAKSKFGPNLLHLASGNNSSSENGGNRWTALLRQLRSKLISSLKRLNSRYSNLSGRARAVLFTQLLLVILLLGSVGKKVQSQSHGRPGSRGPPVELPYSSFLDLVDEAGSKPKSIAFENVRIGSDKIFFHLKKATPEATTSVVAYTRKVAAPPDLLSHLRSSSIPFSASPQPRANKLAVLLRGTIVGFYLLILWRMYKTFSGNSGSGDTPGKLASSLKSLPLSSFQDIQGVDEAKAEVMELVDTLRNPDKYAVLGARAPTGLLLEGPPGTGKTMLARATAATAGVPLLYCSGSDFVEMFVGRGAARIRKLFERANRLAPCIIFVDELDALGKARDAGNAFIGSRGNDEAEQTLNQLLACMDGLDSTRRICVLAATNRKDVLDPALIRPGRFDRIVKLELPSCDGREKILRVHAQKLPGFRECKGVDEKRPNALGIEDRVDLSAVASATVGLSGAELEFLVNEAAIRAVRRVSSALREGDVRVVPHVRAEDFEASLQNFFATRKPKAGVNEAWKNVWR